VRLPNFLIEVGGFAATGSGPGQNSPRDKMLANSSSSYADGIKGYDPHVFAFGSFLEEGANTQVHMFLSGDDNVLRGDGSISFTGSLSAVCHNPPASEGTTVKIRSNLLFIAETNKISPDKT
jgi:hypothetical protein